jgi:hypothetical protein
LFIFSPADSFSLEQIDNCLHGCIDCSRIIRGETICATSSGCYVVWLAGMCYGPVVGKCNSPAGNPLKACCFRILIFSCHLKWKRNTRSAAALS